MPVCRAMAALRDPMRASAAPRLIDCGLVFLEGDPSLPGATDVAVSVPPMRWILPSSAGWVDLLRSCWPDRLLRERRWSFAAFDGRVTKPRPRAGVSVVPLAAEFVPQLEADFGIASLGVFGSAADLCAAGGHVVEEDGHAVAVCCAFAAAGCDVELAVSTRMTHRLRGFGALAAASFIESCRARGIRVHWDAGSEISAGMARALGFRGEISYDVHMRVPDDDELGALLRAVGP